MRKFEVTFTYKPRKIILIPFREVFIKQQKIVDIELKDEQCISPEEFCSSIVASPERNNVVRINIKERTQGNEKPLLWITELFGRIYFYNGIPIVLHRN
jgi:hypothetical protein